jgi:hypothetical protein
MALTAGFERIARKRLPKNPYTVTNVMDVWECDLMEMLSLSECKDKYKYLLSGLDALSKFLHIVRLRLKSVTAVSSAFRSILAKYLKHRRPVWVRTHRGKVFLIGTLKTMLKKGAFILR